MRSHISQVALSEVSELLGRSGLRSETTRAGVAGDAVVALSLLGDWNADCGEVGWKTDGLYMGNRTDKVMCGVEFRQELMILAYEAT